VSRFLKAGRNTFAAIVWNYGEHRGLAQVSAQTGFLLQGDSTHERAVDSDGQWRVLRDASYNPLPFGPGNMQTYYVVGPGDAFDGRLHPWGWPMNAFDDSAWPAARVIGPATPRGRSRAQSPWALVPNELPPMEERVERLSRVRAVNGITTPAGFPRRRSPATVPAHARATILLDQGHLTTAYPQLWVSGGRGARITVGYAESLFRTERVGGKVDKGDRNAVAGKRFFGNFDRFVSDGGTGRLFEPLWWRTFRYLRLSIETADQPLRLEDIQGVYTGYPFARKARLERVRFGRRAPRAKAWLKPDFLSQILDVGWRTARLCAHETYVDCPYYEQLQYAGDTRIQALISLFMSGDDRLMKKAIAAFNESRRGGDPPLSRYPTRIDQYIPPFALWWVAMVHDHFWYRDDPAFIRSQLPGVRSVLAFFQSHLRADGRLGHLPWWNFVDWSPAWPGGGPPGWNDAPDWVTPSAEQGLHPNDSRGGSAVIDLQLLLALQKASDMESALGLKTLSDAYAQAAQSLKASIIEHYWADSRGLLADTAARMRFSQQTNALAVLAGVVEGAQARAVMRAVLAPVAFEPTAGLSSGGITGLPSQGVGRASTYFLYYLHAALTKAGLGDGYLEQLEPWRGMLEKGLTTWAETHLSSPRSDCHAWGASPNVHLFRTVLGVDSGSPGFRSVRVEPHLGAIQEIAGAVPHPQGEIAVSVQRQPRGARVRVTLPPGLGGVFVWGETERALHPGENRFAVDSASKSTSEPASQSLGDEASLLRPR